MSGSSRHRQGWLGQNYEKLILVVVLLGLLASALFLVLQVYKERNALKVAQWNQPTSQPKKAAALSADGLQAKGAALVQPFQMDLGAKGLMVRTGTVVDATLIAAPSSTKNAEGQRDPEMKPTRNLPGRLVPVSTTHSICSFCSTGCSLEIGMTWFTIRTGVATKIANDGLNVVRAVGVVARLNQIRNHRCVARSDSG